MAAAIQAGYMDSVIQNYLKSHQVVSSQNPNEEFIKRMAKIYSAKDASNNENEQPIQVKDMSMEEYKQYISNKISQLPMDASNMQDSVSIQISDPGFEAMKNDPEYEQWVLDSIKSNFVSHDPWSGLCGGKYVILYFGETKEQSRGESWRAGFMNGRGSEVFNQKSEDGFWEQRARRRKQLKEMYEELQEVEELNKDLEKEPYYGASSILNLFKPDKAGSGII